jgi:hypothetical protein
MAQNINKLLAVDEASNGKPTSMYDATRAMIENGIDIDRFMSDGGLALSWDQEDNRVAVVDEEFNTVYTHDGDALPENKTLIWQVVNEIPDDSATSIYLADGFVGEDIHVSVGVDVGDNLNIKSILYTDEDEESKSILIRANGKETVTDISNSSDEITLLGEADKASLRNGEINDKNKLSIYETLADFSIYSGNAVIKSGASVEIVRLLSEMQESISLVMENGNMMITGEDFTLVIEEGAHVGSILGADGNLFDFSEDDDNGGNTEGGGETGGGESTEGGGDGVILPVGAVQKLIAQDAHRGTGVRVEEVAHFRGIAEVEQRAVPVAVRVMDLLGECCIGDTQGGQGGVDAVLGRGRPLPGTGGQEKRCQYEDENGKTNLFFHGNPSFATFMIPQRFFM